MVRKATLLGVAAAALLAVGSAGASGALRVSHIGWVSKTGPGLFTLRIDLNQPWPSSAFAPGSTNEMQVLYDSNGDVKADYTGRIVYRGSKLVEEVSGHGNNYEPVPVSRPTSRSARFTHPFDPLYTGVTHRKPLRIAVRLKSGGTVHRYPAVGWMTVRR